MCSVLQSSSEWSHLNPIRSGAARNTTPVKFSELNGPRMRRVIRIFLEIWLHNNGWEDYWTRLWCFFHWYFVPLVGHSFPQWFIRVSSVFLVFDEPRYIFKSLYLFAYVENAKCWPILAFLSRIHALFSCTFTSLNNAVVYQNHQSWQILSRLI